MDHILGVRSGGDYQQNASMVVHMNDAGEVDFTIGDYNITNSTIIDIAEVPAEVKVTEYRYVNDVFEQLPHVETPTP